MTNMITFLASMVESNNNTQRSNSTVDSPAEVIVSDTAGFGERPAIPAKSREESSSATLEEQICDSPPALDEDCRTSDSGSSIDEEFATETMREPGLDDGTELEIMGPKMVLYSQVQLEHRFSKSSSMYSSHASEVHAEHDIWWHVIRPLDVSDKSIDSPPPLPERNPRRLLLSREEPVPESLSDAARRSRNIRNLRLYLRKTMTTGAEDSSETSVVSTCQHSHDALSKNAGDLLPIPVQPTVQSSWLASTPRNTSITKAIMNHRLGPGLQFQSSCSMEKMVNAKRPRRCASAKDILRWIRGLDDPRSAHGHSRSASDPTAVNDGRCKTLSRWDEAMPSHGTVKYLPSVMNLKHSASAGPSQLLNTNKQLPPLPPLEADHSMESSG